MNRRNFITALASVPFISKAKPADKITVSINEPSKLTSVKIHKGETVQSEYIRMIGEQIQKDTAEGVYELMAKQNKVLLLKGDE